jgi:phasin family protein
LADKPILKLPFVAPVQTPIPAEAIPFAAKPALVAKPAPSNGAKPSLAPVNAKSTPIVGKSIPAKPLNAAAVRKTPMPAAAAQPVAKPKPKAAPAAVPPLKRATPVSAPLITEGKAKVTETFTKIENNVQNFTADATARVKSVMEKGSKGVEELVEFSKGNLEAVVASGRVAAKGAEDIAKYATDYGRTSIEKANATAKQFAALKSPAEFFQLQSELAKSSLDAFVGEASKFGENYMKLLGEIAQPLQSRYALAVEKVKTAVSA